MGKHNKNALQKHQRNAHYAKRFRQLRCKDCGHRTSVSGRCAVCGNRIRNTDFARQVSKGEQ